MYILNVFMTLLLFQINNQNVQTRSVHELDSERINDKSSYLSIQNFLLNQKPLDCRQFETDLIECLAYNIFLKNSKKFKDLDPENLIVKPIITKHFTNQTISKGDNATFTCETQIDSLPIFLFYKLDETVISSYDSYREDISTFLDKYALPLQKKDSFSDYISTNDRIVLERRQHLDDSNKDSLSDLETVNLKIMNTMRSDQGYYLCIVANSLKSFRVTYGFLNITTETNDFKHGILQVEKNLESFFDQNKYSVTVAFFAILFLILVIIMTLCLCHLSRNKSDKKSIIENSVDSMKKNFVYVSMPDNTSQTTNSTLNTRLTDTTSIDSENNLFNFSTEEDAQWEFSRDKLKMGRLIDEGAFGRVFKAEAFGIIPGRYKSTVAVKTLKENTSKIELANFLKELEIMKSVGKHENIISLLGCCTKNGPTYAIVEYAKLGNLKNYLRLQRPKDYLTSNNSEESEIENSAGELANNVFKLYSSVNKNKLITSSFKLSQDDKLDLMIDLVRFSTQISSGMKYLHSKKVCHRDLAARNILLDENKIAKIADFGFARDLQQNYYYTRKSESPIPVKWMAPETLLDRKVYQNSDIWSFGVLMWEIFSLGGTPYPTVPIEKLFDYLKDGNRMSKPEFCDDEIYELMLDCWNLNSDLRPSFTIINEKLNIILSKYENKKQKNNLAELEKLFDKNNFMTLGQKKLLTTNLTINPLSGPIEPLLTNSSSIFSNRNSSLSSGSKLGTLNFNSKRVIRNSESEDSQYFSGADTSLVYTDSSNYSTESSSVYSNYTVPISVAAFSEASKMAACLAQSPPSPPPPKSFSKLLNLASAAYQL
ncbi:unnamed protein product [Brachionus calyciflorus]|uniref:receptor protein-tyrosine kinase n=1 Tax=Brachionus calyciflorus TaxID=104777 RepID=A0A813MWB1_9BILA|nr:unnamed protein product [Brachionus calyciflorus]